MDVWIYETGERLGNPNLVQIWAGGVVIPFRHKILLDRHVVTAGGVNERFKPGAHTRDTHNYFVPPAIFNAACELAAEYFLSKSKLKKNKKKGTLAPV